MQEWKEMREMWKIQYWKEMVEVMKLSESHTPCIVKQIVMMFWHYIYWYKKKSIKLSNFDKKKWNQNVMGGKWWILWSKWNALKVESRMFKDRVLNEFVINYPDNHGINPQLTTLEFYLWKPAMFALPEKETLQQSYITWHSKKWTNICSTCINHSYTKIDTYMAKIIKTESKIHQTNFFR